MHQRFVYILQKLIGQSVDRPLKGVPGVFAGPDQFTGPLASLEHLANAKGTNLVSDDVADLAPGFALFLLRKIEVLVLRGFQVFILGLRNADAALCRRG